MKRTPETLRSQFHALVLKAASDVYREDPLKVAERLKLQLTAFLLAGFVPVKQPQEKRLIPPKEAEERELAGRASTSTGVGQPRRALPVRRP